MRGFRYAHSFARFFTNLSSSEKLFLRRSVQLGAGVALTGALLTHSTKLQFKLQSNAGVRGLIVAQAASQEVDEDESSVQTLTPREHRFLQFASLQYNNQLFMTPRDFLDSVTQERPRSRMHRQTLTESEMSRILNKTPARNKTTRTMFRDMDSNGVISYTEYLFLLCVLTKPRSGFQIAFNMFDSDGNKRVDKSEFLVIQALMLMLRSSGKVKKFDAHLRDLTDRTAKRIADQETRLTIRRDVEDELEEIFGRSGRGQHQQRMKEELGIVDQGDADAPNMEIVEAPPSPAPPVVEGDSSSIMKKITIWDRSVPTKSDDVQNTTLLIHLFGPYGKQSLSYDDFFLFYENLQVEVLELEFLEFSRGKSTISETDFAKILLRYTIVHSDDYQAYLQRVEERVVDQKGITFDEFREFCQFLNNLDDFSIAVKLYTFANRPISQSEFERAVKISTGRSLNPHVVNVVFQVFDVDGDGQLSYGEFIAVMKDRLHRGFRSHLVKHQEGWSAFKTCVRDEMRSY